MSLVKSYGDLVQEQIEQYRDTEVMHDLPAVFHRWSADHVQPGLQAVFGVADINGFYVEAFVASAAGVAAPVFLSLGCGDGAVEIGVAQSLLARGIGQFRFVCYDLSDILLARFRDAVPAELADRFELVTGDLNAQAFEAGFDTIMANHSLHHMVDLEGIFRAAYQALKPGGVFVAGDMIGRNGHMRWPEARLFVDFFWPFLTEPQRNNVQLRRHEAAFMDHDCSTEGFEGIRAQDVLPEILRQGFHPWKFFGFGGFVDVFTDRCFGPNLDVANPNDVFLAQRIGVLNEVLLDAGLIKQTMMLAYFTKQPREAAFFRARTAQAAVRQADRDPEWLQGALDALGRNANDPGFAFRGASLQPAPAPIHLPAEPAAGRNPEATRARGEAAAALAQAQADLARAQATIVDQADRIRAMETSSSWMLTAPMRLLARKLRR